jgi:mannose-6-phosphate isomerase-like protein (cupin superfamily)
VELPDSFDTRRLADKHHAIAPDGSEVRVLCRVTAGSMAHFTLPPRAVSKAMAHHVVEEIWYFLSGHGRMWRRLGAHEAEVEVRAGSSITIPVGTHFQFRCDSDEPLRAVGVTMPPWPEDGDAYPVDGPWQPSEEVTGSRDGS